MRWLTALLLTVLLLLGAAIWMVLESVDGGTLAAGPAAVGPGPSAPAVQIDRPRGDGGTPGAGPLAAGGQRVALEHRPTGVPEQAAGEDAGAGPVVTGRVLDPAGRPLAGATVYGGRAQNWAGPPLDSRVHATNTWSARRETRTGEDGRFELEGMIPGAARLAVRASGCAPYDDDALLLPGAAPRHDVGDLLLERGVVLWGRVVAPGGFGVADAEIVRLDDAPTFFFGATGKKRGALLASAANDGSFRVDVLAPGPWKLMVISDAHPDRVFEGATETPEQGGLVFQLEPGAEIAGRVEGGDREPASVAVRVSPPGPLRLDSLSGPLPWREATCAPDGSFTVGGLEPGAVYRLRAHGGDGSPWSTEWLSDPIEVRSGSRDVRLRLLSTAAVTFRAVAAGTGAALADLQAVLTYAREGEEEEESLELDDERLARDPASGVATLSGIRSIGPDVETTLRVEAEGYVPATTAPFALAGGETRDLGTIELEPRPMMSVRVVDAATGEPIEGARVELEVGDDAAGESESHGADSGPDGVADVPRVEGRDGELWATAPGYAPSKHLSFRLSPGEREEVPAFELGLGRGGALEVTVLTPSGAPVPEASVTCAEVVDGATRNQPVTEGGVALFENLPAGRYRVEVDGVAERGFLRFDDGPETPPESWTEVQVFDGESERVTLTRPPRGALAGRITEGGRALAGAGLRLEPAGGQSFQIPGLTDRPQARTDGGGRYRIEPLNAGAFELVIEHASRVMEARVQVTVAEGENELDVDLPVTIVEGRITSAGGRPAEGARIDVARADDDSSRSSPQILFAMSGQDDVVVGFGAPEDTSARTAADGRYQLRGVLADTELVVTASHPELVTAGSEPFEVGPGEVRDGIDLTLTSAARIEAFATRAGVPLGNVVVRATYVVPAGGDDPGVDDVSEHTDGQGRALLGGLTAGTWSVQLEPPGWDEEDYPEPEVIAVAAGDLARVDLVGP